MPLLSLYSADYMQGTAMSFKTKEDAIHFAEKQGWDYQVEKPQVARIPPKSYGKPRPGRCSPFDYTNVCTLRHYFLQPRTLYTVSR